jgi:hypothetical protein
MSDDCITSIFGNFLDATVEKISSPIPYCDGQPEDFFQELKELPEKCKQELEQLINQYLEPSFQGEEWNNLEYILDCATQTSSIPHFQKALKIVHSNLRASAWKDGNISLEWLKKVDTLESLLDVHEHISLLRRSLSIIIPECKRDELDDFVWVENY